MEDDKATDLQEKDLKKPTMFRMVLSSIVGAVIGSAPGVLMSLLAKKGGSADKFSSPVIMTGSMIGVMIGHDLARSKHEENGEHTQRLKTEKLKDGHERG